MTDAEIAKKQAINDKMAKENDMVIMELKEMTYALQERSKEYECKISKLMEQVDLLHRENSMLKYEVVNHAKNASSTQSDSEKKCQELIYQLKEKEENIAKLQDSLHYLKDQSENLGMGKTSDINIIKKNEDLNKINKCLVLEVQKLKKATDSMTHDKELEKKNSELLMQNQELKEQIVLLKCKICELSGATEKKIYELEEQKCKLNEQLNSKS